MKNKHLSRAFRLILMVLAISGLYFLFIGFLEMGTPADSHLLSKVGVPGLGIILAAAVALTIFTEVFLARKLGDDIQ